MTSTQPSIRGGRSELEKFAAALVELDGKDVATSTRASYDSDFRRFARWCAEHGAQSMPADAGTVAAYLVDAANDVDLHGKQRYAVATLRRWLTSINVAHARNGHPKPGDHDKVARLMAAITREKGSAQRRVRPLLLDDLVAMLETMRGEVWPYSPACIRDTAILLTGFGGAFRRSEISGLVRANLMHSRADGVHLRLESSKTDQQRQGAIKALPYGKSPLTCAPCALWRWVDLVAVVDGGGGRVALMRAVRQMGEVDTHICRADRPDAIADRRPLFRQIKQTGVIQPGGLSPRSVAAIVKRRIADIGLDPSMFAGHSFRSGFVTEALRHGASANEIMRQTGHQTERMIGLYQREYAPLTANAVTKIGL